MQLTTYAFNVELHNWPKPAREQELAALRDTLAIHYPNTLAETRIDSLSIRLVSNEDAQDLSFDVIRLLATPILENNGAIIPKTPAVHKNGTLVFQVWAYRNGNTAFSVLLRDDGGTERGGSDTSASVNFVIQVKLGAPGWVEAGRLVE
jgi:hypothetical protein